MDNSKDIVTTILENRKSDIQEATQRAARRMLGMEYMRSEADAIRATRQESTIVHTPPRRKIRPRRPISPSRKHYLLSRAATTLLGQERERQLMGRYWHKLYRFLFERALLRLKLQRPPTIVVPSEQTRYSSEPIIGAERELVLLTQRVVMQHNQMIELMNERDQLLAQLELEQPNYRRSLGDDSVAEDRPNSRIMLTSHKVPSNSLLPESSRQDHYVKVLYDPQHSVERAELSASAERIDNMHLSAGLTYSPARDNSNVLLPSDMGKNLAYEDLLLKKTSENIQIQSLRLYSLLYPTLKLLQGRMQIRHETYKHSNDIKQPGAGKDESNEQHGPAALEITGRLSKAEASLPLLKVEPLPLLKETTQPVTSLVLDWIQRYFGRLYFLLRCEDKLAHCRTKLTFVNIMARRRLSSLQKDLQTFHGAPEARSVMEVQADKLLQLQITILATTTQIAELKNTKMFLLNADLTLGGASIAEERLARGVKEAHGSQEDSSLIPKDKHQALLLAMVEEAERKVASLRKEFAKISNIGALSLSEAARGGDLKHRHTAGRTVMTGDVRALKQKSPRLKALSVPAKEHPQAQLMSDLEDLKRQALVAERIRAGGMYGKLPKTTAFSTTTPHKTLISRRYISTLFKQAGDGPSQHAARADDRRGPLDIFSASRGRLLPHILPPKEDSQLL